MYNVQLKYLLFLNNSQKQEQSLKIFSIEKLSKLFIFKDENMLKFDFW